MTLATVKLWGRKIGAVSWDDDRQFAYFEYEPAFVKSHIEVSPIVMPLSNQIYSFPNLAKNSFHGLPGLLADSLPDKFGHLLINKWLESQGRSPESFNSVERLCYIGNRGMGALEFQPSNIGPNRKSSRILEIEELVNLASEILMQREKLEISLLDKEQQQALDDILRVGTSAGGARAKALIAWNEKTGKVRSGQINAGDGFSYWLFKFDGVSGNRDKESEDVVGYGLIEYAYSKMAKAAGINMSECRLFEENGRHHFMTKRFDRSDSGEKIHMQSLGALAHYDFNQAGAYSYEQALQIMRKLQLPMKSIEEFYRRMAFNIIARNQDDHVKNIAFLMGKTGQWALSPAFDMTYSYNPDGDWTSANQMTLNGKRDKFVVEDFVSCGNACAMKKGRPREILFEVQEVVKKWKDFAEQAKIPGNRIKKIQQTHRVSFLN